MKVSLIVPCFNEEQVIRELARRLKEALNKCLLKNEVSDYEVIFIDDGSFDQTLFLLKDFVLENKKFKLISFSRNFGHQIAISAGIDFSEGDAAIIMDADLQDPPELIPEMIRKWKEGFKVIHMRRKQRGGEGVIKRILARQFYRLLNRLSAINIPQDVGDFKLLDKEVILYLRRLKEHCRYMRGLSVCAGFNQCILEYDRPARFAGRAKYYFLKSLLLAIDGVTSFSSAPLRLVTFCGFIGIVISIMLIFYALLSKILFPKAVLPGWTSMLIVFAFLSGIQLFSIGLVGEYIGRIYEEVKNRPLYVIREKANLQ